jgi:hypothetical protein
MDASMPAIPSPPLELAALALAMARPLSRPVRWPSTSKYFHNASPLAPALKSALPSSFSAAATASLAVKSGGAPLPLAPLPLAPASDMARVRRRG